MKRVALVALAALVPATAAQAQELDALATMNLHLTQPSYSGCADAAFDGIDAGTCTSLASAAVDGAAFLWVVASREGGFAGGIGGAQFGLDHTGVDPTGWSLCTGGSEIPDGTWPASGSGNAVTWGGGCYTSAGANAMIGFLAVPNGATGSASVTPDHRILDTLWADCTPDTYGICEDNLASADLAGGTLPVCGDQCDVGTPVDEVSWGHVKSLFN